MTATLPALELNRFGVPPMLHLTAIPVRSPPIVPQGKGAWQIAGDGVQMAPGDLGSGHAGGIVGPEQVPGKSMGAGAVDKKLDESKSAGGSKE